MNDRVDLEVVQSYPLSAQQRDILAVGSLAPRSVRLEVRLDARLDAQATRQALDALVASHEILRTAFRQELGYANLRQLVLAQGSPEWFYLDAGAGEAALQADNASGSAAFDLERGRTLHLTLVHPEGGGSSLLWEASPLVAEHASLAKLHHELMARIGAQHPDDIDAASDDDDAGNLPYSQYAEWREELLQGDDAMPGRQYWHDYLRRLDASPDTATQGGDGDAEVPGAPGLAERTYRDPALAQSVATANVVRSQTRALRPEVQAALAELAARLELNVETIAQAAWWVLLARVTGKRALLGGWQHDCRRDYEQLAGTVGPFATTLPLVLDVAPDNRFSAFVERFAGMLEEHRNVQEYWSLSEHAAALSVDTGEATDNAKHQALRDCFVCGFVVTDSVAPLSRADGNTTALGDNPFAMPAVFEFGMQVAIARSGEIGSATLRYRADVYSDAAVASLADQYVTLLTHLPETFDQPVRRQRLLGVQEQKKLLDWTGPSIDFGTRTVPELVHAFALSRPASIALEGKDLDDTAVSLTYAELDQRVRTLAGQLAGSGVTAGAVVGLLLPRSTDQVVALLATLWLGAAYLPLDPTWPVQRRQAIIHQAAPTLVLTTAAMLDAVATAEPGVGAYRTLSQLESTASDQTRFSHIETGPSCKLTDAAYVLFTSGSTGIPKGVVIEHAQLANYVKAVTAALALTESRRFALTSTVAADLGNTALFGALANGATLVIADEAAMENGESFGKFIVDHTVDCLKIVPSHLEALLDADNASLPAKLILGGERVSSRLLSALQSRFASSQIFNHYGPTETTVGVATYRVGSVGEDVGSFGSHGLPLTEPLANCRLLLLDDQLEPVPPGVAGELYIGGAQLCRGYLKQEVAGSFIDDPFHPGQRLYRTGDLGRYRASGGIVLLGRADDQVKIRGFRVDPAEIEAVLRRCQGVGQAVVQPQMDKDSLELVAYVVRESDGGLQAEALGSEADVQFVASIRDTLKQALPAAMQPRHVEILPVIPRLPNGKVNRRALPLPRAAQATVEARSAAPRSALESWLAMLWTELLDTTPGIHDNFFESGGQSLLIVRMVTRINEALRVKIRPSEIYAHPTIATLASKLSSGDDGGAQVEKIARLRLHLASLSPEEQAALRVRAQGEQPAAPAS